MKFIIVVAFVAILAALVSAGAFMLREGRDGKPKTSNMARALAFRVGFSILLFLCIRLRMDSDQPRRNQGFHRSSPVCR